MTTSDRTPQPLDDRERRLLSAWRARRTEQAGTGGTLARGDLDAEQHRLLAVWRDRTGSAENEPGWVRDLRQRLADPAVPLPGGGPRLPTFPERFTGMLLGSVSGESAARRRDGPGDRSAMLLHATDSLCRNGRGETGDPAGAVLASLQRFLNALGLPWQDCVPAESPLPGHRAAALSELDPFLRNATADPGTLTALTRIAAGHPPGTPEHPINSADSAAAVALGAAAALWHRDAAAAFRLGTGLAALTHGSADGNLPAGAVAATVAGLLAGQPLEQAAREALGIWQATAAARPATTIPPPPLLWEAVHLGTHHPPGFRPSRGNLQAMTDGRTGTGALAIGLRAALACRDDTETAIRVAADHDGDTATSAALCGMLLGALRGRAAIPRQPPIPSTVRQVVARLGTAAAQLDRRPAEPATRAGTATTAPAESPDSPGTAGDVDAGSADEHGQRFVRALLGCAVGDALGSALVDESRDEIRARHGEHGPTGYVPAGHPSGRLGSETQVVLFTLEGVIRAGVARRLHGTEHPASHVQHAYQRWLHTQHLSWPRAAGAFLGSAQVPDGPLMAERGLFQIRSPGRTMMRTLIAFAKNQQEMGTPQAPVSDSRGSAALTRALPATLWSRGSGEAFEAGSALGALTHGHPAAHLSTGALAVLLARLSRGASPQDAVEAALAELSARPGHEEVSASITAALRLAESGPVDPRLLERELGTGSTAAEALGVGLYAALGAQEDFDLGLRLAVRHSGNSATGAAVCASLLGAATDSDGIDRHWLEDLEMHDLVRRLAEDAVLEFGPNPPEDDDWFERYPPT